MDFFRTFRTQLIALWNSWTQAQRIGLSAAALASLGMIVGTLIWATTPEYVVIGRGMTPQQTAEMVGYLDTEGIGYEMNSSASTVSVARGDLSRARLATKDMRGPEFSTDFEADGGGMMPTDPSDAAQMRTRRLEESIGRSLIKFQGVRKASVHISRPDPSPFVIEQAPPTASVVIDPTSPGAVNASVAFNLVAFVAGAVDGLTPDNVTLMDTNGRQYSERDSMAASMGDQLDYQRRYEMYLTQKVMKLLELMLGRDQASVEITAELDFKESRKERITYDPDSKVKREEMLETEEENGLLASPFGVAGASANINPADAGSGAGQGSKTRERSEMQYDNSSEFEEVFEKPGRVQRLSVAAIVDLRSLAADGEEGAVDTAARLAEIEQVIKNAVGFDAVRSDEFTIMDAPLKSPYAAEEPLLNPTLLEPYNTLIQSVAMVLTACFVAGMAWLLLKRFRPVEINTRKQDAITREEFRRLAEFQMKAQENPELVARILSGWMEQQSIDPDDPMAGLPPEDDDESEETDKDQSGGSLRRAA